jgi:hypothetical protein
MEYKNFHIFRTVYLPMTNKLNSRFKVCSDRFKQSIIVDRAELDKIVGEATYIYKIAKYLEGKGFNILGVGMGDKCHHILSDTFEPLKTK